MLVCVIAAIDLLITVFFLRVTPDSLKFQSAVHHLDCQTKAKGHRSDNQQ